MKPTIEQREFIEKIKGLGCAPGLENIRSLLRVLGDPQEKVPCIHVAGTNGKGSVCAYISSVLTLAGYKIGVYTSPAVFDERERYTVSGEWICPEEYWRGIDEMRRACQILEEQGKAHPTSFEVETALAFWFFAEKKCDAAVIETGMGGAKDATNVLRRPLCSVFTSVGMDHTQFLGNTRSEIARQKAGIIKAGSDAVCVWQHPEVERVFRKAANEAGAPILFVKESDCRYPKTEVFQKELSKRKAFSKAEPEDSGMFTYEYRGLFLSPGLTGACQIPNSALAAETLLLLRKKGYSISEEQISEGIRRTVWPGRMQQISRAPEIWIDGAHNPDAAEQLKKTLENKFTNRKIIYIMGVLADKDYREMLRLLLPLARRLVTVTPRSPRALLAQQLAEAAEEQLLKANGAPIRAKTPGRTEILAAKSFSEAARLAMGDDVKDTDVILAFGSLSYLKDIRTALEKRKEEISHV